MKKIYLVDVSSLFFRAFYAVRELTSPSGLPVNAVYGFLSMTIKLLNEEKPEYIAFCYDRKEPSFRKGLFEAYKANRSAMPEDLAVQIPYIKKLADDLGIPSFEVPDYEADDLIGTLTILGRQAGFEVVIVSGDKDFGQLVQDHITIYDTMKSVRYDSAGIEKKFGIPPKQFIDYLSITGDSSDNIPGVKGIGEKGAVKLLQEFGSLENIYENLDKISSESLRKKLIESKEQAFLSKKLVTIVTDVSLPADMQSYLRQPLKKDSLRALLQELNFKTFEKNLLAEDAAALSEAKVSSVALSKSVDHSSIAQSTAGDIAPAGLAASIENSTSDALSGSALAAALLPSMDLSQLKDFFDLQKPLWVLWNDTGYFLAQEEKLAAYCGDLLAMGAWSAEHKIQWKSFDLKKWWHKIQTPKPSGVWDTHIAAYVLESGDTSDFVDVVKKYLQADFSDEGMHSPQDLHKLHLLLEEKVKLLLSERQEQKIYQDMDFPLTFVLYNIERKGFMLDAPVLKKQSLELAAELKELETQIHQMSGEIFNIASPKQLAEVLFQKMGLPSGKKTKTGFSTDNDVLEKINHPIAGLVLQYRENAKLKSTYLDALPLLQDSQGRLHTDLRQTLTATGRLSSQNPNLQNIPIRTEKGQRVRQAFIASPGMQLLSADYSQIELRILAHACGDEGLSRAFAEDLDIHAATAAEIYSVPLSQVTSELRRAAKAVNFGIAYGQGAFGLAENLGISRGEAQEIIKRYFEKFKKVKDYIEDTIKSAYEKGYVETLLGRRRYIHELKSKNNMVKKFGERAAINAPMQGTASDIVKKAMLELEQKIPLPMILQIHDELIFEGSESDLHQHSSQIIHIMEGVVKLSVPLKVNFSIGPNWDQAH